MKNANARRHFLRTVASLAGAVGTAAPLASRLAGLAALASQTSNAADTSGGYKALVCLFMHGGSDSHNWVVPIDATGYAEYAAARAELAWPVDRLDPITVQGQAAGRLFGMPRELAPLRKWYEGGQAAVVANVGPLVRPVSRAEFKAGIGLPSKLFSHNDQRSTWQSLLPEGSPSGWGGRMGDILMAANANPVFTTVSTAGNAVFLAGNNVNQFQVGWEGPVAVNGLSGSHVFWSTSAVNALRRNLSATSTDPLQAEYLRVVQRGVSANALLGASLQSVPVMAIPDTTIHVGDGKTIAQSADSLSRQLRLVAQMIGAGPSLGMRRQVFMVTMGGFDTHRDQMGDQPAHMAKVAHAVDYFLTAVNALGLLNNVTLFTASEFGRTLLSNGSGSDHGWGSHHLVAGGAVRGRAMHGRFPSTALGGADDIGSGRLLPSTSVSQMAATMGRWMGLSAAETAMVLPTISNFDANALKFL